MRDYKPNEAVCKRLANMWRKMLESPKYDNGDKTEAGGMGIMLAHMVPKNNTSDVLDKFEEALVELLTTRSLKYREDREGDFPTHLDVDYGPGKTLSDAAEKAGLKMQFPWKTNTSIFYDLPAFSVSGGYCASPVNYYLLDDGRWLVTSIRAKNDEDFDKLKAAAISDQFGFKIEE